MSDERIRFVDLARLHAPIREELLAATARVIDSGTFILGAEVERFEAEFAQRVGSGHAVGCASGTDALVLALLAAGISPGDRVIVPAFSFFATAASVARVGATPVFADIDPVDSHLDPVSAAAAATAGPAPRAFIPVDLYGRATRIEPVQALARDASAIVIEDAAQAIGALDEHGRATGTRGEFGCFSLYPTKNLGALGDAGLVVTSAPESAERLRALRSHGIESGARLHKAIGLNSRLDALQAALISVKWARFDKWTQARRSHASGYIDRFESALGHPTDRGLQLPRRDQGTEYAVAHQFVVHIAGDRRDSLLAHLDACGIDSAIYYDTPLHHHPALSKLSETPVPLPNAETAALTGLALPVHPDLQANDLDRIVEVVCDFLSR